MSEFLALLQVIAIDITLAADNAVVIGMAAAGLPREQSRKAIVVGIIGATVLRIIFALFTTQLMNIVGMLLAGGILLLWVSWKLWRELRVRAIVEAAVKDSVAAAEGHPRKTLAQAALQVVIADVSMSLDNVLAVAGAAREHTWVLVFGLAVSIGLMGLAANLIAGLVDKHRWIAYLGLVIIVYVALAMIWEGGTDVLHAMEVEAS